MKLSLLPQCWCEIVQYCCHGGASTNDLIVLHRGISPLMQSKRFVSSFPRKHLRFGRRVYKKFQLTILSLNKQETCTLHKLGCFLLKIKILQISEFCQVLVRPTKTFLCFVCVPEAPIGEFLLLTSAKVIFNVVAPD